MGYKVEAGTLSRVAEKTLIAIEVEQAAIQGHIEFVWLYDSTTQKKYLESDLPVELPPGHNVFAMLAFVNDSIPENFLMCIVEFIDPDGISRGKANWAQLIGPGYFIYVPTLSVILDKAGLWKIHATLEA